MSEKSVRLKDFWGVFTQYEKCWGFFLTKWNLCQTFLRLTITAGCRSWKSFLRFSFEDKEIKESGGMKSESLFFSSTDKCSLHYRELIAIREKEEEVLCSQKSFLSFEKPALRSPQKPKCLCFFNTEDEECVCSRAGTVLFLLPCLFISANNLVSHFNVQREVKNNPS